MKRIIIGLFCISLIVACAPTTTELLPTEIATAVNEQALAPSLSPYYFTDYLALLFNEN